MKNFRLFLFALLSVLCYSFLSAEQALDLDTGTGHTIVKTVAEDTNFTASTVEIINVANNVADLPDIAQCSTIIDSTKHSAIQPSLNKAWKQKRKRFLAAIFYKELPENKYYTKGLLFNQATAGNISAISYRRL